MFSECDIVFFYTRTTTISVKDAYRNARCDSVVNMLTKMAKSTFEKPKSEFNLFLTSQIASHTFFSKARENDYFPKNFRQ